MTNRKYVWSWGEGELLRITVLFPETVKLLAALFTGIPQHSKSIIGTVKTLHFPHPGRRSRASLCTCCCHKKFFVYIPRDKLETRYWDESQVSTDTHCVASPDCDRVLQSSSTKILPGESDTNMNLRESRHGYRHVFFSCWPCAWIKYSILLPWLGVFKYINQCHCPGWGYLNI